MLNELFREPLLRDNRPRLQQSAIAEFVVLGLQCVRLPKTPVFKALLRRGETEVRHSHVFFKAEASGSGIVDRR